MLVNNVNAHNVTVGHENLLTDALAKVKNNEIQAALSDLDRLVRLNPRFRLAQLIYADLLLSRARPLHDFGGFSELPYADIKAMRDEARARWQHYLSPPPARGIPASIVKLSPQQRYVVVVDMSRSRLFLFENVHGVPRLKKDFYATIGKNGTGKFVEGDQKTPIGVYFVTDFINPEKLPDLYGDGAFPIDYPNVWDQRHGRTGYGIWLHGTPRSIFSRPPRDSDGCVILTNRDLNAISPFIEPGRTPVVLTEQINWLTETAWRGRQGGLYTLIEKWRKDWESRNAELYLSHYSPSYTGLGKDYASWVTYKRRVNSSKQFIKVGINDESMFLYPGENSLLIVTFEQDYSSDNYHRKFVKRQYWRKETDGKWRIVYEGSVS